MTNKKTAMKKWREKNPWRKAYDGAKIRCAPNRAYGKRGIEMLMKLDDFKYLWHRDKAHKMINPSIDRVDGKGNYELKNCRYIEMDANRNPKPVMAIKIYKSAREAARCMGGVVPAVCDVANGKKYHHTYKGYRWMWVEDLLYNNKAINTVIIKAREDKQHRTCDPECPFCKTEEASK